MEWNSVLRAKDIRSTNGAILHFSNTKTMTTTNAAWNCCLAVTISRPIPFFIYCYCPLTILWIAICHISIEVNREHRERKGVGEREAKKCVQIRRPQTHKPCSVRVRTSAIHFSRLFSHCFSCFFCCCNSNGRRETAQEEEEEEEVGLKKID